MKMRLAISSFALLLGTSSIGYGSTLPYLVTYSSQLFAGATNTPGFVNATGTAARFNIAGGLTFGPSNTLYMADKINNAIREINTSTGAVSTYYNGFTSASLSKIVYDHINNGFYTLELVNAADYIFSFVPFATPASKQVLFSSVGGPGFTAAVGFADGINTAARLNGPRDIAVDKTTGYVYIADTSNYRVRQFQPTTVIAGVVTAGQVSTTTGIGVDSSTDGPVGTATLHTPYTLTTNNNGTIIYVGQEGSGGTIRKIQGGQVTTFVPSTSNPALSLPIGMSTDGSGNVYVSDSSYGYISGATPQGDFSKIANISTGSSYSVLPTQDGSVIYYSQGSIHTLVKITRSIVLNGSFGNFNAPSHTDGGVGSSLTGTFTNAILTANTGSPFYGPGATILRMSPDAQRETLEQIVPTETSSNISNVGTAGKLPSMRIAAVRDALNASNTGAITPAAAFQHGHSPSPSLFTASAFRGVAQFIQANSRDDMDSQRFSQSLEGRDNLALVHEGSLNAIESQMNQNAQAQAASKSDGRLGFWVQPFFAPEQQKETVNSPAFRSNTVGIGIGIDTTLKKNALVGISAGTTSTRITLEKNRGSTTISSYYIAPYGSFAFSGIAVDASFLIATNRYKTQRNITNLGLSAKGNHNGYTLAPQVQVSHTFKFKKGFSFEPYLGVGYTQMKEQGYTETGAFPFNTTVAPNTTKMVKTEVGFYLSKIFNHSESDSTTKIKGRLSYINRHTFAGVQSTFSISGVGGPYLTAAGQKTQQLISPGIGIETGSRSGWTFALNYDVQWGNNYLGQQIALRIRKRFGGSSGPKQTSEQNAPAPSQAAGVTPQLPDQAKSTSQTPSTTKSPAASTPNSITPASSSKTPLTQPNDLIKPIPGVTNTRSPSQSISVVATTPPKKPSNSAVVPVHTKDKVTSTPPAENKSPD